MAKLDLTGIFPPVPTAFTDDRANHVAAGEFVENMQKWTQFPFRGIVILGSNGEFPYLTVSEKMYIAKLAKSVLPSDKLLIAGAGCEGTNLTIDLCRDFRDYNIDAVLVHTPHFYKNCMNDDALIHHFTWVADHSPCPVILYNVPSNTGLDMNAETIVKLAKHPNIIGLKDSGGDVNKIQAIMSAKVKSNFQILAGSANFLYDFLISGAVGGVCAVANILSQETLQLADLTRNGHHEQAKELQAKLAGPNTAVTRKYGVPALKHMLDKFGYYGGPPRSPMLPLTKEEKASVEQEFEKAGFTW